MPQGLCHLLVPKGVDDGVQHGCDDHVEQAEDAVHGDRGACPAPDVGDADHSKEEKDHEQVGRTMEKTFQHLRVEAIARMALMMWT